MMNEESLQNVFAEFLSDLEALEGHCNAILHLLIEKRIASNEELAPHLERAAKASSVRWSAVRARINYLLAPPVKPPEPAKPADSSRASEKNTAETSSNAEQSATQASVATADKKKSNDGTEQDDATLPQTGPKVEVNSDKAAQSEESSRPQAKVASTTQPETREKFR